MSRTFYRSLLLLALLALLSVARTACPAADPEFDELQAAAMQNEEIVMQFNAAFNARDLDTLEELLADTLMYGEDPLAREEYLGLLQVNLESIPDIEARVTHLVSDGEHTAVRIAYEGTGEGEYLGHDMDGKEARWTNTYWYDISEGRIEGYTYTWDGFELWTQLEVIEDPVSEE